ncbi:ATP-binding protein [Natronosporangium hydrolyticum]|uniref:ATP-binding protein n=1 Tax=Natronosporangium hydrolyticum TaxID=2811111 RepID=A0A895YR66_9ACTN|nr:ATP-binding protein [Natronosporangium hydrolyticum]QSB16610.1 ATP-binding protein [Natronosporangium hydrolyticum]
MRFFNTAGPCVPGSHYMLPPEPRLPAARRLIDRSQFFVVHAPRQTGKTTVLATLARSLTTEGRYAALRVSFETGEVAGDDYGAAEEQILFALRQAALVAGLPDAALPPDPWPTAPAGSQLLTALSAWAQRSPRPLVLFFDEIDALRGESLRSVLRQLRDGYTSRPAPFPASVVLCGLRDVRDYKAASGGDPGRLGTASPFNVKVASLRIGDFTASDVAELYSQHTTETGQEFSEAALARAFEYTAGQPWLVNALAAEVVDNLVAAPERVTAEHVDLAKERLILARATHLDSLVARLQEPRVRRVVEPLIAGELVQLDAYDDDLAYLRDLGLLAPGREARVANPIYREVIVRVLGAAAEANIVAEPRSFVQADGRLDFPRLLTEFVGFWRQHGEVLTRDGAYHEVAPQLVIMAFLHRVINGGGYIDREYGVGRGRIDLLVRWPYQAGAQRSWQREAMELKVWRAGRPDPLPAGLQQLDDYLQRLELTTGTLVIFDRRPTAGPIADRTEFSTQRTPTGRAVTVLRA